MLHSRLARASAALGDADGCQRALDDMHHHFAQAGTDAEPVWVSYVDDTELAAQEGACYLDLGLTDNASAALQHALALLDQHAPHRSRDRVHYLIRLAVCHLAQHEVEQACAVATEALTLHAAIGSARIAGRLYDFAAALGPYETSTAVQAFQEQLRESG